MSLVLWLLQLLLAAMFLMAGSTKATRSLADLATMMPWTADVPGAMVRFIGLAEVLGALGLILPAATRVKPGLTPLAGACLALVMVLAALFHLSRGEMGAVPFNLGLGALAAFVAWGRWTKAPIAARS